MGSWPGNRMQFPYVRHLTQCSLNSACWRCWSFAPPQAAGVRMGLSHVGMDLSWLFTCPGIQFPVQVGSWAITILINPTIKAFLLFSPCFTAHRCLRGIQWLWWALTSPCGTSTRFSWTCSPFVTKTEETKSGKPFRSGTTCPQWFFILFFIWPGDPQVLVSLSYSGILLLLIRILWFALELVLVLIQIIILYSLILSNKYIII